MHMSMKQLPSFLTLALVALSVESGADPQPLQRSMHRESSHASPAIGADGIAPRQVTANAFGGYVPYHNGVTLICSDCHVMHASEEHGYAGEGAGFPRSNTPYRKLLRQGDPVDVCLACHDGRTGIPDVIDADTNALVERAAGWMQLPENANYKGHNLGRGLTAATLCNRCHFSGTMATAEVSCIDCHNPHGNNKMRNLQWASFPGGEPEFAIIVQAGATGLAKFERSNVAYGYAPGVAREVTNMCIDCHHAYFDDSTHFYTKPGGFVHYGLHPNFNSEWGAVTPISGAPNADAAHWEGGSGTGFVGAARVPFVGIGASTFAAASAVDATTNAAFCLSCHKAHGSANAFSLTWVPITGPGPKGCDQCHAVTETP
jgi:hypothetical protein